MRRKGRLFSLAIVVIGLGMMVVFYLALFTDTFSPAPMGPRGSGNRTANADGATGAGAGNTDRGDADGANDPDSDGEGDGESISQRDPDAAGDTGSGADSVVSAGDPDGATVHGIVVDAETNKPLSGQQVTLSEDVSKWSWGADTYSQARETLLGMSDSEFEGINRARKKLQDERRAVGQNLGNTPEAKAASAAKLDELARGIERMDEAERMWKYVTAYLRQHDKAENLQLRDTARGMVSLMLARDLVRDTLSDGEGGDDAPRRHDRSWSATTDAEGRFRFTDVPPAMYGVVSVSEGHQTQTTAIFTLAAAETRELRLLATPAARFVGRVVDSRNQPVAGAQVRLVPELAEGETPAFRVDGAPEERGTASAFETEDRDAPPTLDELSTAERAGEMIEDKLGKMPGAAVTAKDGSYVLRVPKVPGTYKVIAWSDLHGQAESEVLEATARARIDVPTITLPPLTGLKVTVVTAGEPTEVTDPDGNTFDATTQVGVYNALVRVLTEKQKQQLGITASWDGVWDTQDVERQVRRQLESAIKRTDQDGNALFIPLEANTYFVKTRRRGMRPSEEFEVVVAEGQVTELTITLAEGLVLTGKVVDYSGMAVAGAEVTPMMRFEVDGESVAGAEGRDVDMQRNADGELVPVSSEWAERKAKTDDEGNFRIGGLSEDASRVDLLVQAVGFLDEIAEDVATDGNEIKIELTKAMRVEGDVRQSDGTPPLPDFKVFLRPADAAAADTMGPRMFGQQDGNAAELSTRSDGHFIFSNVTPGRYYVEAFDSHSSPTRSEEFEISRGVSAEGLLITLAAGGVITGQVIDPTGAPVAEAVVTINDRIATFAQGAEDRDRRFQFDDGNEDQQTMARLTSSARTLEDGTFRIEHVPPGAYTVYGAHQQFAKATVEGVNVVEGGETNVIVRFALGGTIKGVILDPAGTPIPDIEISLGAEGFRAMPRQAKSDKDGRFEFTALDPGRYRVTPSFRPKPGEAAVSGKTVTIKGNETIEIQLGGPQVGGTRLVVHVKRNGKPYAEEDTSVLSTVEGIRRGRTDKAGQVVFENLAAGAYVLAAGGQGRHIQNFYLSPGEVERQIDFNFNDSALEGKVVDVQGNPIAGASVAINPIAEPGASGLSAIRNVIVQEETTDAAGRYRFGRVSLGSYRVVARKEGFAMTDLTTEVGESDVKLNIEMQAGGGVIKGKVTGYVNPNAVPFMRGWVRLERADGSPLMLGQQSHLLRGPEFTFTGLAVGTYNIIVQQDGGVPHRKNGVQVKMGQVTEVEFRIAQAGAAAIHVRGDFGSFIGEDFSDLSFEVLDGSTQVEQLFSPVDFFKQIFSPGESESEDERDPNVTTITLNNLPAGNFTLRMSKPGFRTVTKSLVIKPGETTDVEVMLERE